MPPLVVMTVFDNVPVSVKGYGLRRNEAALQSEYAVLRRRFYLSNSTYSIIPTDDTSTHQSLTRFR